MQERATPSLSLMAHKVCRYAIHYVTRSSLYLSGCENEFFFADKLISVAKYYGFDGWFFNIECSLDTPMNSQRMARFVEYMRKATKVELGEDALTLWYDSVTREGKLKYVCVSSCCCETKSVLIETKLNSLLMILDGRTNSTKKIKCFSMQATECL